MNHVHHTAGYKPAQKSINGRRLAVTGIVLALAGLALWNLLVPHKVQVVDALPYIFISAMLLMHLGHGGHNHGGKR